MDLKNQRKQYERDALDESTLAKSPLVQFETWLQEALQIGLLEPYAMTLATVGDNLRPQARIVLLRQFDETGFYFFTNYESRKGQALASHPHAALLFYWALCERQVRIEGSVKPTEASYSDNYFASRPIGSRFAAWASPQSKTIASRSALESRYEEWAAKLSKNGEETKRPPHWGGYVLVPETIEFWQGRPNRLHDRLIYRRGPQDTWIISRLAP